MKKPAKKTPRTFAWTWQRPDGKFLLWMNGSKRGLLEANMPIGYPPNVSNYNPPIYVPVRVEIVRARGRGKGRVTA
jgi:hypothetical protein